VPTSANGSPTLVSRCILEAMPPAETTLSSPAYVASGNEQCDGEIMNILIGTVMLGGVMNAALNPAGAPTPAALAELVVTSFAASDVEAFTDVYPHAEGRDLVRSARRQDIPLRAGEGRVIWSDGERAVLFLSGFPEVGNSGDETIYARMFSGLYEAEAGADGWRLGDRIPIDGENRILAHAIEATLLPGKGLELRDVLDVDAGSPYGFWAFLNHAAQIDGILVDGHRVEHVAAGGLLWVPIGTPGPARITIDYTLDLTRDAGAGPNSGRFEDDFGHVRNQYFWHPFFDFHSSGDRADFEILVHAPADVQIVTSLPQESRVSGDTRTVHGRSEQPTSGLTLLYDRNWVPVRRTFGSLDVEFFVTPQFQPAPDQLAAAVGRAHRLLSAEFGEPKSTYLALIEGRARNDAGWQFMINNAVVSGPGRAVSSRAGALPRAWLGHEVAHAWTAPTGPGANFLTEGWAMFAESMLLEDEYGTSAADAFWESYRNWYHVNGFDGEASILNDPNNGGVAYYKGVWILRMLRDHVGSEAFRNGMRAYMQIAPGLPAGIDEFMVAMSTASGRDVESFLRPWLAETTIPDIDARIDEGRIVMTQNGPLFELPLDIEVMTPAGAIRQSVQLTDRVTWIDTPDIANATAVHLDPDHRLLIRRRRGDVVRFELEAPDADSVRLAGNFGADTIEAIREDGSWVVELPLTEGTYAYWWLVDGAYLEAEGMQMRMVRPVQLIPRALPR
jgi:hypothetical protein